MNIDYINPPDDMIAVPVQEEHVVGLDVLRLRLVVQLLAGLQVVGGEENDVDQDQEHLHRDTWQKE